MQQLFCLCLSLRFHSANCFLCLPSVDEAVCIRSPFLWSTSRGYHILTHNLHGAGGRTTSPIAWWVGYAFSPDYIHWRYSHVPVATNTFTSSEDGTTTVKLNGRERPQASP